MDKRQQVSDQCKVVAHLAEAIRQVFSDKTRMVGDGNEPEAVLDYIGKHSASLMNTLGDILNGMDAVMDDDEWVNPIFERAKQLYPE